MGPRLLVTLVLILAPRAATACAVCLDSAAGSRGFGWPFVVLMLAPFAVVAGLAGALVWGYRRGPDPPPAEKGHRR